MAEDHHPAGRDEKSSERVREVLYDCLCRRAAGESLSDATVVAAHPDLMPGLEVELQKLQVIGAAWQEAAAAASTDRRNPEFNQLSASETATSPHSPRVRCPTCQVPVELAADTLVTDITCSSCGSHFSLARDQPDAPPAVEPICLGRFTLSEPLGSGGFGTVWKARDSELDRDVAIKIPRKGQLAPEEIEQFVREARAAAQLRHPHIVSVHEVGREDDDVYIVSDFVPGQSLAAWLTDHKPTGREVAATCALIADAIDHAHQQGVIHRDLKPANVIVDGDFQPYIMDFGLAKRDTGDQTVTLDGEVMGTPAYMSPEQARGESRHTDARSDIFSLGVMMYEMLTGERPFRGSSPMVIQQVLREEPAGLRKLDNQIALDLETICLKCLQKNPAHRYQSAAELATELRRFLAGEPIHSRPISRGERLWRWCKRKPTVASLAAATAVLLFTVPTVAIVGYVQTSRALDRAESNLMMVREPVDEFLVVLGESKQLQAHGLDKLRRSLLEKAGRFYEKFVDQNPRHPELRGGLGEAYYSLAQISENLDELSDAEAACLSSIAIFEQLASDHPRVVNYQFELARSYVFLGHLCRSDAWPNAFEKTFEAEERFKSAEEILTRLTADHPATRKFQLALAGNYGGFGSFYEDVGRPGEAVIMFRKELAIRKRLAGSSDDALSRHEFALCHYQLGWSLYRMGDADQASHHYQTAIDIWSGLLDDPSAQQYSMVEEAAQYWQSHSRAGLGMVASFAGRSAEAKESYRSAIQRFGELVDQRPDVPKYELTLAHTHHNLGIDRVRSGDWEQAETAFQSARDIAAKLFAKYGDRLYQIDQAAYEGNLGNLYRQQRHYESAAPCYTRSIALARQALAAEARNIAAERIAAVSFHRRAEVMDALGRRLEAADDWKMAAELDQGAARTYFQLRSALALARSGDHEQATQLAAAIADSSDPLRLYDVARVYALAAIDQAGSPTGIKTPARPTAKKNTERALAALRQAIARGYRAERHLDRDPDLKILREQPGYQRLRESIALLPADLIPADSTWMVSDNGSDPGPSWFAADFEDADWRKDVLRLRQLGREQPILTMVRPIPEILYASAFFRTSFDISPRKDIQNMVAAIYVQGGCAVYLNGVEVHRDDSLRPGVSFSATATLSGSPDHASRYAYVSLPAEPLRDASNVLAVEVHRHNVSSSEVIFHLTLSSNVVGRLVESLENDRSLVRTDAASILGQLGPAAREALPALRAALDNEDQELRSAARDAIARIETHDAR